MEAGHAEGKGTEDSISTDSACAPVPPTSWISHPLWSVSLLLYDSFSGRRQTHLCSNQTTLFIVLCLWVAYKIPAQRIHWKYFCPGWRCPSVEEHFPSMCNVLGSDHRISKSKQTKCFCLHLKASVELPFWEGFYCLHVCNYGTGVSDRALWYICLIQIST